jgi:hypothetical protein
MSSALDSSDGLGAAAVDAAGRRSIIAGFKTGTFPALVGCCATTRVRDRVRQVRAAWDARVLRVARLSFAMASATGLPKAGWSVARAAPEAERDSKPLRRRLGLDSRRASRRQQTRSAIQRDTRSTTISRRMLLECSGRAGLESSDNRSAHRETWPVATTTNPDRAHVGTRTGQRSVVACCSNLSGCSGGVRRGTRRRRLAARASCARSGAARDTSPAW